MEAVAGDPFFIKAALWAQIVGFISGVYLAYVIFERRKGWTIRASYSAVWQKIRRRHSLQGRY